QRGKRENVRDNHPDAKWRDEQAVFLIRFEQAHADETGEWRNGKNESPVAPKEGQQSWRNRQHQQQNDNQGSVNTLNMGNGDLIPAPHPFPVKRFTSEQNDQRRQREHESNQNIG